ncbi:MAG: hypothetical protein IPO90_08160 [Flavobacteriales bacterium]|nr:hypothetical protein [Flavobacteriales bacterium]
MPTCSSIPRICARTILFAALTPGSGWISSASAQGFDTAAVIMGIEQRMADVDKAPIRAVFLTYVDKENAVLLLPDSAVVGEPAERHEIYVNTDGTVAGVGTFLRSTYPGVVESACHYFDPDGHSVAVSWTMKWAKSQCTDSIAIETRYIYFHPIGESIMEYATLTDQHGQVIDHTKCMFPDIERHFDAYYHRDMFLLMKHISLE